MSPERKWKLPSISNWLCCFGIWCYKLKQIINEDRRSLSLFVSGKKPTVWKECNGLTDGVQTSVSEFVDDGPLVDPILVPGFDHSAHLTPEKTQSLIHRLSRCYTTRWALKHWSWRWATRIYLFLPIIPDITHGETPVRVYHVLWGRNVTFTIKYYHGKMMVSDVSEWLTCLNKGKTCQEHANKTQGRKNK